VPAPPEDEPGEEQHQEPKRPGGTRDRELVVVLVTSRAPGFEAARARAWRRRGGDTGEASIS